MGLHLGFRAKVASWPTYIQGVVNWPNKKQEVSLRHFRYSPISRSRVVCWPTKNCKLAYVHHFKC